MGLIIGLPEDDAVPPKMTMLEIPEQGSPGTPDVEAHDQRVAAD
jgi:hypothetical protein